MILAGIDEAGLGPRLGPLVVALSALRTPDDWDDERPWLALGKQITRKPSKRDPRIAVCDSKVLHARLGVAGLCRPLTALLTLLHGDELLQEPMTRSRALHWLTAAPAAGSAPLPWYATETEHPHPDGTAQAAAGLDGLLAETGTQVTALQVLPLTADALNARFDGGRNKSEVLQDAAGVLVERLAATFPNEPIRLTVDRQGGRVRYHPFLSRVFPGTWIDILSESPILSAYRVRRADAPIEIVFRPRADGSAFCVALASIAAKWTRELYMHDLNAFFRQHLPDLPPTAGYAADAPRFIEAVRPVLAQLRVDDGVFVRIR